MSPVALGQTEGSGQRIGERGRNHHAKDEPQAGVVVGERGEGQYRHGGDRLRADSTALSASRKIRTTRAASSWLGCKAWSGRRPPVLWRCWTSEKASFLLAAQGVRRQPLNR